MVKIEVEGVRIMAEGEARVEGVRIEVSMVGYFSLVLANISVQTFSVCIMYALYTVIIS